MKLDDVLALAHAGFNREEISALLVAAPGGQAQPATQVESEAPAAPETAAQKMYNDFMKRMDEMSSRLYHAAVSNTQQPAPQTADDVLASIIAPPQKGE